MPQSSHHTDADWLVISGKFGIQILYHTSISMSTSVSYDERSIFGSHGAYAVWTGTEPRTYSVSASLVAANGAEVNFNIKQAQSAYAWTQDSPPPCQELKLPTNSGAAYLFETSVRIESFDASIPESTHILESAPVQIEFSLGLKECKAI